MRFPSTKPDPRKTMKIVGNISKLRRTQPQTLEIYPNDHLNEMMKYMSLKMD